MRFSSFPRGALVLAWALSAVAPAQSRLPTGVISQVYGGGGNAGATLREDFIEVFNAGDTPADVSGWTVQYAPAAGSSILLTPTER